LPYAGRSQSTYSSSTEIWLTSATTTTTDTNLKPRIPNIKRQQKSLLPKHKQFQTNPHHIKLRESNQETSTKASKRARTLTTKTSLNHEVPQEHKKGNNQTKKIIPTKTHTRPQINLNHMDT
jgi:hypothetical protein